jgi:hypothetical protein
MSTHRFSSFEEGVALVEKLIDHRNLEPAYYAAQDLARQFHAHAQSHFLYNLVVCLSNRGGGARYSQHILDDARRCPDFDGKINGDMQRDRAIGLIRFASGPKHADLILAESIIGDAQTLHAGDPDRLACLRDINGRLLYAKRRYRDAAREHEAANTNWAEIGDLANPVWVYNNKVHWLKATVAGYGRDAAQARWLERDIMSGPPEGSRNRGTEARIIRGLPLGTGNLVHDWLTRHR